MHVFLIIELTLFSITHNASTLAYSCQGSVSQQQVALLSSATKFAQVFVTPFDSVLWDFPLGGKVRFARFPSRQSFIRLSPAEQII